MVGVSRVGQSGVRVYSSIVSCTATMTDAGALLDVRVEALFDLILLHG